MKLRTDIHIARRLYHMFGVCIGAYAYWTLSLSFAIKFMSILCFIGVISEIFRAHHPQFNRKLLTFFGPLIRRNEYKGITGMTYLVFGALLIIVVFEKRIVTLALLLLAFGDPISSIVGITLGKRKILGKKTVEGALAGFVTCTVVALIYYYFIQIAAFPMLLWVSLATGLIGMFSELIPVGQLDDNFTFPVISASLIWILFQLLNF